MQNVRKDSPSFHRNIGPIREKLNGVLSGSVERILEIGSGSGQHVAQLAEQFPDIVFQPSEYDRGNLKSINAWSQDQTNVLDALELDVTSKNWFVSKADPFDALLCFNVIHISPWKVTEAIFNRARYHLNSKAKVIFYGPFKINGEHTSKSNQQFETWLKEHSVDYGVRDIADVEKVAMDNGFTLQATHSMPANNFMPVFLKS